MAWTRGGARWRTRELAPEVEGDSYSGQARRGERQDVVSDSVLVALGHAQVW